MPFLASPVDSLDCRLVGVCWMYATIYLLQLLSASSKPGDACVCPCEDTRVDGRVVLMRQLPSSYAGVSFIRVSDFEGSASKAALTRWIVLCSFSHYLSSFLSHHFINSSVLCFVWHVEHIGSIRPSNHPHKCHSDCLPVVLEEPESCHHHQSFSHFLAHCQSANRVASLNIMLSRYQRVLLMCSH